MPYMAMHLSCGDFELHDAHTGRRWSRHAGVWPSHACCAGLASSGGGGLLQRHHRSASSGLAKDGDSSADPATVQQRQQQSTQQRQALPWMLCPITKVGLLVC